MVAPDGRVSFDDRRLSSKWQLIPVFPKNHPRERRPWSPPCATCSRGGRPRGPRPSPPSPRAPSRPGPLTEADRRRRQEPYDNFVPVASASGTFNLTDEYYRMLGEDPYRYEKARFLSSTFDLRLKMAAQAQVHDLRQSLHDLPARLDRLWKDPAHPPSARRLIMCALFDELRRTAKTASKPATSSRPSCA